MKGVYRTKNGYSVRWREGKKNRSRTFRKRKAAEDFKDFLHDNRALGAASALTAERPFEEVAEEFWRSHNQTVTEGTRKKQRAYLVRVLDHFEGYRLCDVRAPDLEAFRLRMEKQQTGAPTQRKILFLLSKLFRYAVRMGYLDHNPVSVIDKPSAPRQRLIQPFVPERVEKVREWFLARDDLESATLVSVLAYAGPRPEEAHSFLTWADIMESHIIFRGEKTDRDRITRLLSPLRDDLSAWQKDSGRVLGRVFDWTNARFNTWRDTGGWRKMVDELDLKINGQSAVPYDLRHSFATLLAAEGKGIDYISEQLGNSHTTCERYYRHLVSDNENLMDAEERIYAVRNGLSEREEGRVASGGVSPHLTRPPLAESDKEAL